MECVNCTNVICDESSTKKVPTLPKGLKEKYVLLSANECLVEDKELKMDSNDVLKDFVFKRVKCGKCGIHIGKHLTTLDDPFLHLKGFVMVDKSLVSNITRKEAIKERVVILPDEDTETDDLFTVGLTATCKDAEKLITSWESNKERYKKSMEEIKGKNESLAEVVKQLANYMFSITGIKMSDKKEEKNNKEEPQKRRFANQEYAPKKCRRS